MITRTMSGPRDMDDAAQWLKADSDDIGRLHLEVQALQSLNQELVDALRKLVDRNMTWINGVMDYSGITYEDVQQAREVLAKFDLEAK